MTEVIVFVLVVAGTGGFAVYRFFDKGKKEAIASFKPLVMKRLKVNGLNEFDYGQLCQEVGVSETVARSTAEELYSHYVVKMLADGVITDKERKTIDRLGDSLKIDSHKKEKIEKDKKIQKYKEHADLALADGVLTPDEAEELQNMANRFNLSTTDVKTATGNDSEQAFINKFREVLHDGRFSEEHLAEVKRIAQTFGISPEHGKELIREDSEQAYREYFYELKSQDSFTEEDENALERLKELLGLSDEFTKTFSNELQRIKTIANVRSGNLPVVKTKLMLDGGELCHFHDKCRYEWNTSTKTKNAQGEITATDRRLIFTSNDNTKNFNFSYSSIINIDVDLFSVTITTSGSRGNGNYGISDPDLFQAVITTLIKKSKFIAIEGFSAEMTRHIPKHVKQEVWARDGGKCVECGATHYLEYDHIIPHSKGGANTTNNIQLLCRECNLAKSDRIG